MPRGLEVEITIDVLQNGPISITNWGYVGPLIRAAMEAVVSLGVRQMGASVEA